MGVGGVSGEPGWAGVLAQLGSRQRLPGEEDMVGAEPLKGGEE